MLSYSFLYWRTLRYKIVMFCLHLSGVCQSISLQQCINRTDYKLTSFPNFAGHRTQKELTDDLEKYAPFLNEPSCYAFSNSFFCSLLSPECRNGRRIPPCRAFCNGMYNDGIFVFTTQYLSDYSIYTHIKVILLTVRFC